MKTIKIYMQCMGYENILAFSCCVAMLFTFSIRCDAQRFRHELSVINSSNRILLSPNEMLHNEHTAYLKRAYGEQCANAASTELHNNLSYGLQYMYYLNKNIAVGGAIGKKEANIESFRKIYDEDMQLLWSKNTSYYILPAAKYAWYSSKSEKVKLYSKLGLGIMYSVTEHICSLPKTKQKGVKFAYQVTGIGANVNFGRFGIFAEFGYGSQGIAAYGICMRF